MLGYGAGVTQQLREPSLSILGPIAVGVATATELVAVAVVAGNRERPPATLALWGTVLATVGVAVWLQGAFWVYGRPGHRMMTRSGSCSPGPRRCRAQIRGRRPIGD